MEHNEITGAIIDLSIRIHSKLGPGLLESVYQRILVYELRKAGFETQTEVPVPVHWDGHVIDEGFRADIIVEGKVLIELKSVESIQKVHHKQTLTYLRLTGLELGLLVNFGAPLLKDGVHRIKRIDFGRIRTQSRRDAEHRRRMLANEERSMQNRQES